MNHQAPVTYKNSKIPIGPDYLLSRSTAIQMVGERLQIDKPYRPGEFQKQLFAGSATPPDLLIKELNDRLSKELNGQGVEFTKDQLIALGLGTAAIASLPFFTEAVIPLSALGLVFGWKAYKAPDESITKAIHDANLLIAQQLWNDPASKRIMTSEVKNLFRDVYGMDFSATMQQHKDQIPQQLQEYVDLVLQASVDNQEALANYNAPQ